MVLDWLQRESGGGERVAPRAAASSATTARATGTQPHRISVNNDLNKYAFLVTLVHEFAHYTHRDQDPPLAATRMAPLGRPNTTG